MWKLVISPQGNDSSALSSLLPLLLKSTNNHTGRQFWEYDPNLGTPSERAQVEEIRRQFHENRFQVKHSSDLLMRLQVT